MRRAVYHKERHFTSRIGWLRAAVLGANDGLVSTASLIIGVVAASTGRTEILVAGIAGLVAGAMSMAAGEYVSVSSQADTERADLAKEASELAADPQGELEELAGIYRQRGLDEEMAMDVAIQLTAKNALQAHARDELNITSVTSAQPVAAAFASATSFSAGAVLPLLAVAMTPASSLILTVSILTIALLGILGAIGARLGGAPVGPAIVRVGFWGAAAMAVTAGIGSLTGSLV